MGRGGATLPCERWLNNYKVASSWIASKDVEAAVDAHGGLVRIENFLPEHVAEGILSIVSGIPETQWNDTSASTDYTHNNISHSFASVKNARGLDAVRRLFSLIQPDSLNAFSAAKYCKRDHIAPHDDRAYTKVKLDSGRIITTSRTLAVIYYLTRDWREEYGGVLVDLEDPTAPPGEGRKYVPLWNSVVAFRVPRYHAVTALTTARPRYSIFGWFLEPGKLYPLYRGEDEEGEGARQQATKKRKLAESDGAVDGATKPAGRGEGRAASDAAEFGRRVVRGGGKVPAKEESGEALRAVAVATTGEQPLQAVGRGHQKNGHMEGGRSPGTKPCCGRPLPAGQDGATLAEASRKGAPAAGAAGALAGAADGRVSPITLRRGVGLPGRWQGRRKHMPVIIS